jgi:general secretion pathway protein D
MVYRSLETNARVKDGGTIVLGGWTHERTRDATSGVPVLRNLPYIGRLVFGRNSRISEKTNLLIFLTAKIVD